MNNQFGSELDLTEVFKYLSNVDVRASFSIRFLFSLNQVLSCLKTKMENFRVYYFIAVVGSGSMVPHIL